MRTFALVLCSSLLLSACSLFEKTPSPGARIDQSGTLKVNPELIKQGETRKEEEAKGR